MDFTGEIHPVAALFPMLPDDELEELAADIKVNGLIHPIVLDHDGQLIDGRNRLRACSLAGVEPQFTALNGHDPVAYILSSNVNRRHMTAGQRAMALARTRRLDSRHSLRELEKLTGVTRTRISYAEVVIDYAPDQVESVASAAKGLDWAYAEARKRKEAATSDETRFADLQQRAPDLASQVVDERLTLGEALAALTERDRKRKEDIALTSDRLSKAIKTLVELSAADRRARTIDLFSDEHSYLDAPLTRSVIEDAAHNLSQLAEEWPR
jgi:hypothetical protein